MRKTFFILILSFIGGVSLAQNLSSSPYSSFGLGEMGGLDHPSMIGLGNSTATYFDSTQLNYFNPASYNTLARMQPLFSTGISTRLSDYSEGDRSYIDYISTLSHLAMAFPIKNHFGLVFGLKPFSRRGYDFNSRDIVANDSIEYNFQGSGNINEVFTGFSTDLLKVKNTRLAIGGNFGYLFGGTENFRSSSLKSDSYLKGAVGVKQIQVSAFHYEIGMYLTQSFGNIKNGNHHLVKFAATLDPTQKLSTEFEEGTYYAFTLGNPESYDTISIINSSGNISTATSYSVGLNYQFKPFKGTKKNNNEYSLHASYSKSDWSTFSNPFNTVGVTYLDATKISVGFQFTPESKDFSHKKFYQLTKYRVGIYNSSLPYQENNEQIKEIGTTFGFGVPIIVDNFSLSSLNFGFSVGKRGVNDSNRLNENFYGFNVGLIIAPGADRWFRKIKLN